MPLCEALPPCRGRRAHHAQKDRVGTWDVPRLTTGLVPIWSASGRRGAVADDARAREVGLRHSSCEASEQGGAIRCGAGGAKGGDQGECRPANHASGTVPSSRVTRAGSHTKRCYSSASFGPEVGAVCGKAARTDLCGGRSVMSVPTATALLGLSAWAKSCTRRAHAATTGSDFAHPT